MTNHRTVESNLETLLFSRKDEDLKHFAERFDAQLHFLKSRTVLLDRESLPEETDANVAGEQNKLKEKRLAVWCELVQSLDRKSLSLIKTANLNATLAWKLSQHCFKSRERPRILQLLN